jgi:hypothetical protein
LGDLPVHELLQRIGQGNIHALHGHLAFSSTLP